MTDRFKTLRDHLDKCRATKAELFSAYVIARDQVDDAESKLAAAMNEDASDQLGKVLTRNDGLKRKIVGTFHYNTDRDDHNSVTDVVGAVVVSPIQKGWSKKKHYAYGIVFDHHRREWVSPDVLVGRLSKEEVV